MGSLMGSTGHRGAQCLCTTKAPHIFGKKGRIIFLRVTRNVLRSVESELVSSPLF